VFSEWLNTAVRASWAYAPSMPIVPLLGVGLAPFLQWLLLPPLVAFIAFRRQSVPSPRVAAAQPVGGGAQKRRFFGRKTSR